MALAGCTHSVTGCLCMVYMVRAAFHRLQLVTIEMCAAGGLLALSQRNHVSPVLPVRACCLLWGCLQGVQGATWLPNACPVRACPLTPLLTSSSLAVRQASTLAAFRRSCWRGS
jgi:hypothetical protein